MKNTGKEIRRIGRGDGEVIALCRLAGEAITCAGVECPMYQRCWGYLNPDPNGYIEFEFEEVKFSRE
ncbi:MAG: hypothetical protein JRD89_01060 [Deltaproteobacteria bacterium]|nr:hypothetical protein [Deltaproteobacteria bacterium]